MKMKEENGRYVVDFKRNEDLRRYDVSGTNERVVVPVDFPCKPVCKWNALNNDLFSLRQRHLNNLVKMSTTLMIRVRATIRLGKIKRRFEDVIKAH
jgi:hypothetical protein